MKRKRQREVKNEKYQHRDREKWKGRITNYEWVNHRERKVKWEKHEHVKRERQRERGEKGR